MLCDAAFPYQAGASVRRIVGALGGVRDSCADGCEGASLACDPALAGYILEGARGLPPVEAARLEELAGRAEALRERQARDAAEARAIADALWGMCDRLRERCAA